MFPVSVYSVNSGNPGNATVRSLSYICSASITYIKYIRVDSRKPSNNSMFLISAPESQVSHVCTFSLPPISRRTPVTDLSVARPLLHPRQSSLRIQSPADHPLALQGSPIPGSGGVVRLMVGHVQISLIFASVTVPSPSSKTL